MTAGVHHRSLSVCLADNHCCCPAFYVETSLNENHHRYGPSDVYHPMHLPNLALKEMDGDHKMYVGVLWVTGTVHDRRNVRQSSGCPVVVHGTRRMSLRTVPVAPARVPVAMAGMVGLAIRAGRAEFLLGGGGCPLNRFCLDKISRSYKPFHAIKIIAKADALET